MLPLLGQAHLHILKIGDISGNSERISMKFLVISH